MLSVSNKLSLNLNDLMETLYWSLKGKNVSKLISMHLKDNMGNQIISDLYTDDKKTNYCSNPNGVFKSA